MVRADHLHFAKAFLRHPARVGAIAPSSPVLAEAMVEGVRLGETESVLELGPGTGPFTKALADRLGAGPHYLGIEKNPAFVERLQKRFPTMRFVEGSAEDASVLVDQLNLPPVRTVICGLPFASLPRRVQDGVIHSLDELLGAGGEFRTFQYVHAYALPSAARFRRRMSGLFGRFTRTRAIWRNVPPAYVLCWQR